MIWSTEECIVLERPDYPKTPPYILAGKQLETNTMTKYLSITATYDGIVERGTEARI